MCALETAKHRAIATGRSVWWGSPKHQSSSLDVTALTLFIMRLPDADNWTTISETAEHGHPMAILYLMYVDQLNSVLTHFTQVWGMERTCNREIREVSQFH